MNENKQEQVAPCYKCSAKDIEIMHLKDTQAVNEGRIDELHKMLVAQHTNLEARQEDDSAHIVRIKDFELSLATERSKLRAAYLQEEMDMRHVTADLRRELGVLQCDKETKKSQIMKQFDLIQHLKAELAEYQLVAV